MPNELIRSTQRHPILLKSPHTHTHTKKNRRLDSWDSLAARLARNGGETGKEATRFCARTVRRLIPSDFLPLPYSHFNWCQRSSRADRASGSSSASQDSRQGVPRHGGSVLPDAASLLQVGTLVRVCPLAQMRAHSGDLLAALLPASGRRLPPQTGQAREKAHARTSSRHPPRSVPCFTIGHRSSSSLGRDSSRRNRKSIVHRRVS